MHDLDLENRTVRTIAFTQRIRDSFDRLVREFHREGALELPVSAKLAAGRKPNPD